MSDTVKVIVSSSSEVVEVYAKAPSNPSGGGITGVGSVNQVVKIITLEGADGTAIVTVGNSDISDTADGVTVLKNVGSAQYINLYASNTTDNIAASVFAQSDADTATYQAYLTVADSSFESLVSARVAEAFLRIRTNLGADVTKVSTIQTDICVISPNITAGTYAYFEDDGSGNIVLRSGSTPGGSGTVGQVVKVKTINGGGNIILLEDSHTNEGANLIRTEFIGGTSKDYQIAIGDNNFEGGRLFIHAEGAISTSDFTVFDSDYSAGIVSAIDSMEIAVKDLVNAVDLTRITLSTTSIQIDSLAGSINMGGVSLSYNYPNTGGDNFFIVDPLGGIYSIGDLFGSFGDTWQKWDDTAQTIILNATNGVICYTNFDSATYSVGGTAGDDGTFTTVDLKTVTVTKGIITAIV